MLQSQIYSLIAFLNSLRTVIERNLSGKEFHTLATINVVDFKPKVVVFLRGTISLLMPLKHFTLLCTTNKSLIYPGNIRFRALQIHWQKNYPVRFSFQDWFWRHDWSLQIQKKIQDWMGFEPMTSAILVLCSTTWAIKPTGIGL